MRDVLRGYGSTDEIEYLLLHEANYRAGKLKEIQQDSTHDRIFETWAAAAAGQSVFDLLSPPMVGAWLDHAAREPRGSERRKRLRQHAGNYALAAVLQRGMSAELKVPLYDGRLVLPALGRTAILGHGTMANVTTTDDRIIVTPTHGTPTTFHYSDLQQPSDIWQPIRHLTTDSGKAVVFEDQDPFRDIFSHPVSDTMRPDAEFAVWNDLFKEAWHIINEAHPDFAVGLQEGLHTIVPAGNAQPAAALSMASNQTFGAIATTTPRNAAGFASHIVNGFLKDKIIVIQTAVDNLTVSPDDPIASKDLRSPSYEGVCRPLDLFLHAYINTGLAGFFEAYSKYTTDGAEQACAQLSLARWYDEAQRTINLLKETEFLQANGDIILRKLESELTALEPITAGLPVSIKHAVEVSALDQAISWRLYNLTVDTRQPNFPARVIRNNKTHAHIGRRNRYILQELQLSHPDEFWHIVTGGETGQLSHLQPGDRAFAAGDIQAARNAYRRAIYDDPQNSEAWAGFALTFHSTPHELAARALLARPEVVMAVYASLGHTSAAPEVIAERLSQTVPHMSHADVYTEQ